MTDLPRIVRRASLIAFPCVLAYAIATSLSTSTTSASTAHAPPPATLAGTWDIPDHLLDDGATYHVYIELKQTPSGLTGRLSFPFGYLPIASTTQHDDHFQLFDPTGKLLAEGDRSPGLLHLTLSVGRHAGLPRTATPLPTEPLPSAPPYPELHPVPPTGQAPTPPMGWNSWNNFKEAIDDRTVRSMADAMVATGMRDAGYVYLNIDDSWQGPRDTAGNLTANRRFPDMPALAAYVHARGLKLGLYSSPGPLTCAGYPGSLGHEEQDAHTFAAWGIDYLKYDWCSAKKIYTPDQMHAVYQKMGDALAHAGRPILFSLCQYGEADVWTWAPSVGASLWRTTEDIHDTWDSMSSIGFSQSPLALFAAPGGWNDPDMLEVGNGHMSTDEYRTHFSLWCLLAAPLLAGNDLAHMSDRTRSILLNHEAIAIDQDTAGKPATLLRRSGQQEIWSRPLADGAIAVGLFNRAPTKAPITLQLATLGRTSRVQARNVWTHTDLTLQGPSYSTEVPPHGVILLRLEAPPR